MYMISKNLLVFIVLLVVGCATIGPINNEEFDKVGNINKIEGVYKNLGESGDPNKIYYLSEIIWPNDRNIQHEQIETIVIRKVDKKSISVEGMRGSRVIKSSILVVNKDYELTNNGINIKTIIMPSLEYIPGVPFIGLSVQNVTLGIDKNGDGKYRDQTSKAGVAYFIIPVASSIMQDVRFKKREK